MLAQAQGLNFYWLRNVSFDSTFLILPLVTGIFFAALCTSDPALFPTILAFDLWLLGYHHVIATYTRIAFDWASAKAHKFLVFGLPPIVLGITFLIYWIFGSWIIATIYFYWQWFHYIRQSYGISRYYLSRSGKAPDKLYSPIQTMALYALPITGILYRSWQAPETFLFMQFWTIPVPYMLVIISGCTAAILIAYQLYSWFKLYRAGHLHGSYALYVLSHHLIFLVSYILIDDISIGWLAINMWHNMQYIIFVWLQNNNKFKNGIDESHRFISRISQDGKIFIYMLICLAITFFIYQVLMAIGIIIHYTSAISFTVVIFMTLNFHHYIVDSIIWKRKKPKTAIAA